MKTQLTAPLLQFLINRGYQVCLSKTTAQERKKSRVLLTLTPVKLNQLPHYRLVDFDDVFAIRSEPAELAKGKRNTTVMVKINPATLSSYNRLSKPAPITLLPDNS